MNKIIEHSKNVITDFYHYILKIFVRDLVPGIEVARYYEKSSPYIGPQVNKIRKSKFKKTIIDLETAKLYRNLTDNYGYGSMMDHEKMNNTRDRLINYYSLKKYPPIVRNDGLIWDGNHRLQRAIELKIPKIPVLKEI